MCKLIAAVWFEYASSGCGAGFQLEIWPDRTRYKVAAAIGTQVAQFRLGAVAAESALERADNRFRRFRWQILVAALATGAQFKHAVNASSLAACRAVRASRFLTPVYQVLLPSAMSRTSFALLVQAASRKPRSVPVET